jgi:hypothetical protein
MANYFIKYKKFAICAYRELDWVNSYTYRVIPIESDMEYEYMRLRFPYANCIKMDLREQLFGKNLSKTLPLKIKEEVSQLIEIKDLIRDEKIERLLNN